MGGCFGARTFTIAWKRNRTRPIFFGLPSKADLDGRSVMLTFVFAPLMMVAAGMLAGVWWAGLFMFGTFFGSSIGARWMKLCGTKGSTSTRLTAAITVLLATGIFIFLSICVWLGKV